MVAGGAVGAAVRAITAHRADAAHGAAVVERGLFLLSLLTLVEGGAEDIADAAAADAVADALFEVR
jgi:hypothetical protein